MRTPPCAGQHAPAPPKKVPTLAVPDHGAYTGAYMDFGDQEDAVTLEGIEDFEELVGKHQAIVAFSSFWGEQRFPAEAMNIIRQHGSIPLIFWSPWDWPYREENMDVHEPDKFRLESILTGTVGRLHRPLGRRREGARHAGVCLALQRDERKLVPLVRGFITARGSPLLARTRRGT